MKVLHVIPSVAPCRGGPSTAVLAMARALKAQGAQADIVTTNDNGPSLLPVATGIMQDFEGCNVCFLPRWAPRVAALREFQYSAEFSSWLAAALPRYDGLHVHAIFSYLPTRAMIAARRLGMPFIVRPLGQLDPWSLGQKAFKKRLYFHAIEKRSLAHAAAVHCTSEMEAGNVHALLPRARTEVIPHGVEPPPLIAAARSRLRQALGLPEHEPVLLFLSRWHPKKNIPLLLEALAGMKSEPWALVLAGSADARYAAAVHQAVRLHGLEGRVHCPGHVQGEEKALLLQGADAFVLPSSSENFGLAVAEALVNGLPAVVTGGVDLAPVVAGLDGGVLCEASAASLRAGILQVLARPADKARLREEAQRRFAWAVPAEKLSALYAELFHKEIHSRPDRLAYTVHHPASFSMTDISAANYSYASAEESHMHKYFVPPILGHLAKRPGARVLDLGCGNGALCGSISKAGFEVVGVDVSGPGIMHARQAWPGLRFESLGVYDEPPAEFIAAFDVVISTEVVEHLYAPRALAELVSRLLKPGGMAMITTPYHGYWKNLAMALCGKWDSHHNVFWDHGHIKFWSRKTLRKLFEDEKLVFESFEGLGRFPYLWMTMLMCFSKPGA